MYDESYLLCCTVIVLPVHHFKHFFVQDDGGWLFVPKLMLTHPDHRLIAPGRRFEFRQSQVLNYPDPGLSNKQQISGQCRCDDPP